MWEALAQLGITLYVHFGEVSFTYTKPLRDKCKDPGRVWLWSCKRKKDQKKRRGKYYDGCDNSCAYLCQYRLPSFSDVANNPYLLLEAAKEWKDKVDMNYKAECE